uniref:Tail protein n=1 Tax=viral metagenome TaxID=1070528 RepID=A0A6M3IP49_9ZZZZ
MAFVSAVNTGFYNLLKLWPETSARNTNYAVGDVIKPTSYASHSYKCTTAGTSHASVEPTWTTTNGNTTADGTAVFTCYDTKTYNTKAKQGDTVPYITFGLLTDRPMATFEDMEKWEDLTFWVNCFSDKPTADIAEIADEVMTALDGQSLTVTGYTHIVCRREFIGSIIWDAETGIFQIPLRYRIQQSKD